MLEFWVISTVLSICVVIFFVSEFVVKKPVFWRHLYEAHQDRALVFVWPGCDLPGMRKIVIRTPRKEYFHTTLGIRLDIPSLLTNGWDVYGDFDSYEDGIAVFETYLGRGAVRFEMLLNIPSEGVTVELDDNTKRAPLAVYRPHWWQKLGIYG